MPYELVVKKRVSIVDRDQYINECCIGGDLVADALLPMVRERYGSDIQSNQEDWGWFVWFDKERVGLAIDIHTDDPDEGVFRIHLTSRTKGLFGTKIADTPELDELRDHVVSRLEAWSGAPVTTSTLDENYM